MASLIERHRNQIAGVLSCYDRVVIRGTLPSVCYANAMATTLDARDIRLFDYAKLFAEPLRDAIKAHATKLAAAEGIEVEYIKKPTNYRKEDRIRQILAERGTHPGLVHIFSVMELCSSYRPWHDKRTGLTHLRPDPRQMRLLLLLLHRRSARSVLSERADLVSVSGAVLLQRPQLARFQAQSRSRVVRVAGQRDRFHQ